MFNTVLAPDMSLSIKERVRALADVVVKDPECKGPDAVALKKVILVSASERSTEWELDILPVHINKTGNLHGGAAATILDNLTSACLHTIAKPGYLDRGHVSRTITMTYLRPVPLGTKAKIFCEVIAAGKNTANIRGEIRNEQGNVCVTCVHDKVVFPGSKL